MQLAKMRFEIISIVSSTGMLVNNEVTSKLAITTLSGLMSLFKSSWTKENESLMTKELVEIGVRRGMKNLAILYE